MSKVFDLCEGVNTRATVLLVDIMNNDTRRTTVLYEYFVCVIFDQLKFLCVPREFTNWSGRQYHRRNPSARAILRVLYIV